MVELKNVGKRYGKTVEALSDINLSIGQGEIIGLFGENGAGKTTLMKCILGFLGYTGEILLDGEPIDRSNIARLSFGTCEFSFFPELTAMEHADFYADHFPKFRKERFRGLIEFFEFPAYRPIKNLSMGQKSQIEVILALSQGADYIFLDEPFVGHDIFNREDFYKVLLGILEPTETIILSTHLIEEVEGFIDRAVMIHKGKIIGDVQVADIEENGDTLVEYVKKLYGYESDRVSRSLEIITGEKTKRKSEE
ncbi:MAG: ABC transporter ATP-binding protein [Lachnospiraceae bacterium]|nr:ABC transporter ATP-binding protein [Lachnospiraceae bacterium]